jgi:hypothetical protein
VDFITHITRVANASPQACQGQGAAARAEALDFADAVVHDDRLPELTGLRFSIEEWSGLRQLKVCWVVDEVRWAAQDLVLVLVLEVNLRNLLSLGGGSIQRLANCCATAADEKAT